jgi:hypothetical protein
MLDIQSLLELFDYKVTTGVEYVLECFGPNAYTIMIEAKNYEVRITFDTATKVIYLLETYDYVLRNSYRLLDNKYKDAFFDNIKQLNGNSKVNYNGNTWVYLETAKDWLEKTTSIVNGEPYDERILVPMDLSDADFLKIAKMAHERDITVNTMVEHILTEEIKRHKSV